MKRTLGVLLLFFGALLLFTAFFTGCGKANDNSTSPNTYPKQVSVTYRVSSQSETTLNSTHYTNETGGLNQVQNFELPFSKSVSMSVNSGDDLYLSYSDPDGPNVKLEILVDNTVVKTQTFTGNSGAIDYYFP
ncbi:MAG TPA: hypothetical protein VIN07_06770 [Flavipsychrobacter sp.]